ncbi:MAG: DUF2637 domain-containing protein [Brachybacterium sp.]|uniref:DUF2637 domain-containing protein n=1 Tax=Brachybacterium sp. TaxID=1891286 RepID=UPI00264757F3|nr:DUF2637 domain-containing protein [Brachybacterium sp.]MDN5685847.1 DUF2637 domain-containing protein [Brachybacterium sp.]
MSASVLPAPRLAPRAVRRALIAASAVGAVSVALLAFAMSFDALTQLARGAGIRPAISWMWPVVVDGSMIVATAAALVLRTSPVPATRIYPWAQLGLFGLVSVIGNGLHATGATDLPGPVAVAVSGIPPVALLLSTHLLVMMLPRWRWTTEDEPAPSDEEPAAEPAAVTVRHEPADRADDEEQPVLDAGRREPAPELPREPARSTGEPAEGPAGDDEAVALAAWIWEEERAGASVSGRMVADYLGVSLSTGKRRLRVAREQMELRR